jgi:hypothetical protein
MYSRLDQQRERYGAFLFIRDEKGLHNCFFEGCGQSYRHNFSRHVSQHEKRGDKVDLEFVEKQRQKYKDHPEATNPTWRTRLEKRQKEPFFRCKEIIEKMRRQRNARPFLTAVDPDKLGIPDYYDIIKEPMDLGTVARKLERGEYRNFESFAYDVRLIFKNAKTYNPPNSQVQNTQTNTNKNTQTNTHTHTHTLSLSHHYTNSHTHTLTSTRITHTLSYIITNTKVTKHINIILFY